MKILRGISSFIVALVVYVIIPGFIYRFLSYGQFPSNLYPLSIIVNYIRINSGVVPINLEIIGSVISILAFLRSSSENMKRKIIFSILQLVAVIEYLLYLYLNGWVSLSVPDFFQSSFTLFYGGIFILFMVIAVSKFARSVARIIESGSTVPVKT